jgi:hypothetical protein
MKNKGYALFMSPETIVKVQDLVATFLHTFRKEMEKCDLGDDLGYINLVVACSAFEQLVMEDFKKKLREDLSDPKEINAILDAIAVAANDIVLSVAKVKEQINHKLVN